MQQQIIYGFVYYLQIILKVPTHKCNVRIVTNDKCIITFSLDDSKFLFGLCNLSLISGMVIACVLTINTFIIICVYRKLVFCYNIFHRHRHVGLCHRPFISQEDIGKNTQLARTKTDNIKQIDLFGEEQHPAADCE